MWIDRGRVLGALLIVGIGSLGAKDAGPGVTSRPSGPQEALVTGVVMDPQSRQPVVLLQGKRDRRSLAMVIGQFEAAGIAMPLQGMTPPRPLTHDLFLNVLGDLRASLSRIVIIDLREDVYYAQLHLDVQGQTRTIDARPSDAIALALRARVPILVEDRVFDKADRREPRPGVSPTF